MIANCMKCGKDAGIRTSLGPMCQPCFHLALKTPQKEGEKRLYSLPDPQKIVFVVVEPEGFITVDGTLYAFYREKDAEDLAKDLRKGGYASKAKVIRMFASMALAYVLSRPELRLVGVEKRKDGEAVGPDEIAAPRL